MKMQKISLIEWQNVTVQKRPVLLPLPNIAGPRINMHQMQQ
jgi:hypothetical protein